MTRDFSKTIDGLDIYCEMIRGDIAVHAENLKSVDFDSIPSKTQRGGLTLLVSLLQEAEGLAAQLRYDVCADQTDCPEHDDFMRRRIEGATTRIFAMRDRI